MKILNYTQFAPDLQSQIEYSIKWFALLLRARVVLFSDLHPEAGCTDLSLFITFFNLSRQAPDSYSK